VLPITLRQLEYAVAVGQLKGVSLAATELNVSQPAISMAIARLEEEVGRPLFIRRRGSLVVPTSFGRPFLREAQSVLAAAGRLIDPDEGALAAPTPVAVGCFTDLAPILLAPALTRFRKHHPAISVTTQVGDFDSLTEALRGGRIDFALTYELGFDGGFVRQKLASLQPHAIVATDHWLAGRQTVTLRELAGDALILSDQTRSVQHLLELFHRVGVDPHIAQRDASLETMRSLSANDFGVGIAYTRPTPRQSYDGRPLAVVEIADEAAAALIVMATHRTNPPTPSAQSLMDTLTAERSPSASGA
jgi:DNA-binding transcriptional LysR family regulator